MVNPFNATQYLQDSFFEGPLGEFQKVLAKHGIDLHTYDMAPLKEADRVISFCHYDAFQLSAMTQVCPKRSVCLSPMSHEW